MLVDAGQPGFGYFTAALIATTGIAFASGMQFAAIGLWRRREAIHLSYAALCLCIAGLALGNVLLRTADGLPEATIALRWMISAAALSFIPLVVFIRAYTGTATSLRTGLVVAAVAAIFLLRNWTTPSTLFFTQLQPKRSIVLPWGEHLYAVAGSISAWGWVFHAATYGIFLWAVWRAWLQYRRGEVLLAALLGVCLLVQVAALLWGDLVVDLLDYPYPYFDVFAFLPFVLLMSLSLAAQLRQRSVQLEEARQRLEVEELTRHEAELDLRHLAYHDSLTGLPNRASAMECLASSHADARARGRQGAVLLIDLDNFKTVNEGLGHQVGDRLLQTVASRLRAMAPQGATLARLGGDEFVLVLGPLQGSPIDVQARAQGIAQDMITHLLELVPVDARVISVGASVGVATFPADEDDVADLLRRADIALYQAKAAGRGTVRLFRPDMQQAVSLRMNLERGLRTALEQDRLGEQFMLHFQPQVTPAGKLLGAETLLRWRHPQLGEVSPERFIPLAEETGLIHGLGAWIVDEACAALRRWDRDGVGFSGQLGINVSARQLAHPHFAGRLVAQVHDAGISPSRLTLELTESALLKDFDDARLMLAQLASAGFQLALDDFGMGYSSLSYLQRLPLHMLKIDRVFVSELPDTRHPLAGFIVDLAHRLGMSAVAEGVETVPQRMTLERMGCDGLQGFHISRPVDDAGFRQWLAGNRQPATTQQ